MQYGLNFLLLLLCALVLLERILVQSASLLSIFNKKKTTSGFMQLISSPPLPRCNDLDSCMSVHLNNSELVKVLGNRCKLETYSRQFNISRRITFTHLPKTGGSSVRLLLTQTAAQRTRSLGHEHFLQAFNAEPSNLFATMLRDPVSRAISYFAYVQEFQRLDNEKRKNKLMVQTYRAQPVKWANSTFIQRALATDPLGFFLTNVKNIEDSISRFNYSAIHRLPQAPYNTIVPGTLHQYTQYTSSMPVEYQCLQHLEVAFILLKQYEVVGTLEQKEDFYSTLFRRAQYPKIYNTTFVHANPTKYKIVAAEKEKMKEYLQTPLFCGRVLWRIAGLISEADAQCVNKQ